MNAALDLSPILPLWALAALAAVSAVTVALALWRGSPGWALRGLAALALLAALAEPVLRRELRDPLPDVAVVVIDESASNAIDGRDETTAEMEAALAAGLALLLR